MADESDLPEAARRRLSEGAWTSGLSAADFASCLALGAEPAGFVQGFAVMSFSTFMMGQNVRNQMWGGGFGGNTERFSCPHGFVSSEHRTYGFNTEQQWLEERWSTGWGLARQRMVEEAAGMGAHGVIDVTDARLPLAGTDAVEFRMQGTAVRVPGVPVPPVPFITTLSGQRLAKLLESGFVPVTVVGATAAVLMYGYCVTAAQLTGNSGMGGGLGLGLGMGASYGYPGPAVGAIDQVVRAQGMVRDMVRQAIAAQIETDDLHGATFTSSEREAGEATILFECTMKGNRIRRFAPFEALQPPEPVLVLR